MKDPEVPPKLRMAPTPSPEELSQRFEREQRAQTRQREADLESALAPYRVGSVPFLNAVPLTRGLEEQIQFMPPSQLAVHLRRGDLDAALVSVTEVLFNEGYDVLDGIAVASLGEVKSVFLAHRRPVSEVTEVYCDPASLTSVQLLKVLLAERGLRPQFKTLESYEPARLPDFALLIGNAGLDFLQAPHEHALWDLGAAWFEMTRLPFVYAVWALRRGIDQPRLCRLLREARDFGLETLDYIIAERTEYDYNLRKDYLGWHIHYHMGADEKRGLTRFIELLRKNGATVHDPRFVS